MYGHALDLLHPCTVPGCTRPATARVDDQLYCAADALTLEQEHA